PDRPDRGEEPARGSTTSRGGRAGEGFGQGQGLKVIVLGGTRFIGRATVEELAAAGDEVMVVHRGVLEPDGMPEVRHLHGERAELVAHRAELHAFEPEAVIDCRALTRRDAEMALEGLPDVERWIV